MSSRATSPVESLVAAYVKQGTPEKPARALAQFTIEVMDRAAYAPGGRYILTREDRNQLELLQELAWGSVNPETEHAKTISVVYANGGVTWNQQ